MKNTNFYITNEINGYTKFVEEILKLKCDDEMHNILETAWWHFRDEQLKHPENALDGWGLVEGMFFNSEDPSYVYIGME